MFYPSFGRGRFSKDDKSLKDLSTSNVSANGSSYSSKDSITGRFDPTALERGAKALRDLDSSPNANKAFEITRLQEITRQTELKKQMEELQSARSQMQVERARIEAEEKRKYLAQQQEQERITARYKAQLEAEAYAKKLEDQQKQNEQCLERQHQHFLRQEQIRKENERQLLQEKMKQLKQEKELEKDLLKLKIHEEAKGRIMQERENIDVHLREIKTKAKEQRKTQIASIQTALSSIGASFNTLLSDKKKMTALVSGTTALAVGIYGARSGTHVMGRYIEARLGQPKLIRETSRWTFRRNWKSVLFPWLHRSMVVSEKIVLPRDLSERLQWTANTLVSCRRHKIPFRHILLYGSPGTGKTLFARTLARESGLDYAVMAGGDIGPLGRDAVTKLNEVFVWAKKSRKGLVLFIDEAEAFLKKGRHDPSNSSMSEETRNVLSAFLHQTGTESSDICIILATNEKDALDKAVLDRLDEQFEFPLPGFHERLSMIKLFFNQHIRSKAYKKAIKINEDIDDEFFEKIARETEGFSGRQLAKLILGMEATAFGSGVNLLTRGLAETVLQWTRASIQHQDTLLSKSKDSSPD